MDESLSFECMDCHQIKPWIASADEKVHWHLCLQCVQKRPPKRREHSKAAPRWHCPTCGMPHHRTVNGGLIKHFCMPRRRVAVAP